MRNETLFERLGIEYQEVEDIFYPLLSVETEDLSQSVGKYGDMWIAYLKEKCPCRYRTLVRLGMLRTKAMAVNEEAYELLEMTEAVWLKNHKPKNSNSFLEQYGLRVKARMLAEEMVLQEIVYQFH